MTLYNVKAKDTKDLPIVLGTIYSFILAELSKYEVANISISVEKPVTLVPWPKAWGWVNKCKISSTTNDYREAWIEVVGGDYKIGLIGKDAFGIWPDNEARIATCDEDGCVQLEKIA